MKYTKEKQTTELQANVKKALSDELAKKSTFDAGEDQGGEAPAGRSRSASSSPPATA